MTNENLPPPDEHWALDKRIPLAIVGAIVIQTLSIGWFVSKLDSRIGSLEEKDKVHETMIAEDRSRIATGADQLNSINGRLIRVEVTTANTEKVAGEINGKVDSLLRRSP